MTTTAPALEITGLVKRYPRFTLGPVDLSVPSGSIFGLIGPNGAGKSTLIDIIFGMGGADAGAIKVGGLDYLRDEVSVKHRAAYVGPDLNYGSWGTVRKVVRFIRGFRPTWDDAYAAELMEKLGLAENEFVLTQSFGGRMKLALLLALAWRPQVLILDEPTTGLDARARQVLFAELLSVVKDEERTVVISSHQITDLERFADRIGILHQGRLLVEGGTGELVERFLLIEGNGPAALARLPGISILEQEGSRFRAVLDTSLMPLSMLALHGATQVEHLPQTLEELFLTLTR